MVASVEVAAFNPTPPACSTIFPNSLRLTNCEDSASTLSNSAFNLATSSVLPLALAACICSKSWSCFSSSGCSAL